MTTAWAHLPNAKHIDWVLADLNARLDVWDAARGAAWGAAGGTLLALVAYDEAGEFVDHSVDQLKVLHRLTKHPMYLLLQLLAAVKGNYHVSTHGPHVEAAHRPAAG